MSKSPKTLTNAECEQLLAALDCQETKTPTGRKAVRNKCIALLMLDAGLRLSEVCGLRVADLIFNRISVESLVITHNNDRKCRERTIPVSIRLQSQIGLMWMHWWSVGTHHENPYAFYVQSPFYSITGRQVERIINSAARMAFGRTIHPHVLRHTFASRLMKRCNIRIVQKLLGHKHLSSTQIYTHPSQQDLVDAING